MGETTTQARPSEIAHEVPNSVGNLILGGSGASSERCMPSAGYGGMFPRLVVTLYSELLDLLEYVATSTMIATLQWK